MLWQVCSSDPVSPLILLLLHNLTGFHENLHRCSYAACPDT